MAEHEDATDEDVYFYLTCLFPRQGDEYGVPEFATYELDHVEDKGDKIVFMHRGVQGDVYYDMSFVLKPGNKKYTW